MYFIDKTLRSCFRNSSALLFFLNFLEHFLGGCLNKASRIHSSTVKHSFGLCRTFPNTVFVVRHESKSRIYARIGVGTSHSHLTNLESTFEAVLSAVRFNYCANIDRCLHFSRNTQILELESYAHGDEPNLNTSSHCMLDMRTIGVEWVVSL